MALSTHKAALSWLLLLSPSALGQVSPGPVASQQLSSVPIPDDHPFLGSIQLSVDATDTAHGLFQVQETISVQSPRELILLYPEWETTSHGPTISALELAGLRIQVDGSDWSWRRDPLNVHAFHVMVPPRSRSVTVQFQYLPRSVAELRPEMLVVQWAHLLLYPAGWYARDIPVAASLRLPPGLHAYTALTSNKEQPVVHQSDASTLELHYATETLDRLIDAPVYAGRYVQETSLGFAGRRRVDLDVLADSPEQLAMTETDVAQLRTMIAQTEKVFGPPPFSAYRVLASVSDELSPGGGQEHLEEGENNLPANYFTDSAHQLVNRDLIIHEYVHAWNGRYRQPASLWSPNFNLSSDPSLLWVYEGQTEFWGRVLAARSGMRSYQETLDRLALDAAVVVNRPGREWKTLSDSTLDPLYMPGHVVNWRDWQRREDYYAEGVLLWLDVDSRLRELSHDAVNLDDFAHSFFAALGHSAQVSTYTFDDVCMTLNSLAPDDWKHFLTKHLETHSSSEAAAGLARAGWRLVYTSSPSETFLQSQSDSGAVNLDDTIGLQLTENGSVKSIVWNGPAFRAGLRPHVQITRVNGLPFSVTSLLATIANPTEASIFVNINGKDQAITIPYSGPLRYPRLEAIPGAVDRLSHLLQPR